CRARLFSDGLSSLRIYSSGAFGSVGSGLGSSGFWGAITPATWQYSPQSTAPRRAQGKVSSPRSCCRGGVTIARAGGCGTCGVSSLTLSVIAIAASAQPNTMILSMAILGPDQEA